MRLILYTFLALFAVGLVSCRKNNDNITIQQFDQNAIQTYIQQNGITGMIRDTSGGDTTGIYYKVIQVGTGKVLDYSDIVTYVYSLKSFDGSYSSTDTIVNHAFNYVGRIAPNGLQLSIKNILKRKGSIVRLLIPSRLGYGRSGAGSGSTVIKGNECLDYTINVVNNDDVKPIAVNPTTKLNVTYLDKYDDISIQKYLAANGLTGYNRTASGLWYKITQVGTGTAANLKSSVDTVRYVGSLLNGTVFDDQSSTATSGVALPLYDVVAGFAEGLQLITAGGKISLFIPSSMGYGNNASSGSTTTIPGFSCLHFEVTLVAVTN